MKRMLGFLIYEAKAQNILFSPRQTHMTNDEFSDCKVLKIIITNNLTRNDHIEFILKWLLSFLQRL